MPIPAELPPTFFALVPTLLALVRLLVRELVPLLVVHVLVLVLVVRVLVPVLAVFVAEPRQICDGKQRKPFPIWPRILGNLPQHQQRNSWISSRSRTARTVQR